MLNQTTYKTLNLEYIKYILLKMKYNFDLDHLLRFPKTFLA